MKILRPESPWIGEDEISDEELVIATTREEVATMVGALNETLEAVDEWEFDTRVGVTVAQARELRSRLREILQATYVPE